MRKLLAKSLLITAPLLCFPGKGNAMKSLLSLLGTEEKPRQTQVKVIPLQGEDQQKERRAEVSLVVEDKSTIFESRENHSIYGVDQIFPLYWTSAFPNISYDSLTQLVVMSSPEPSTPMVEFLEKECPNLVSLKLSDCPNLTVFGKRGEFDKSIYWMISYPVKFQHLNDLVLTGNSSMTEVRVIAPYLWEALLPNNTGLQYLSIDAANLRSLNVDGSALTNDVLDAIPVDCPLLAKMSCKDCSKLSNPRAIESLPMLSSKTRKLMNNKTVSVIGKQQEEKEPIDLTISFDHINPQMSRELAHIPLLTRLKLYNVQIGDDAVRVLLTHNTLRSFYVMSDQLIKVVGNTSSWTTYFDEALPVELPSLEELWFVKCPYLTDLRLVGHKLTSLYTTDNPALSDFRVASSSVRLIDVSRSGISNESHANLEKTCPNAKHIRVEGCPNIFIPPSLWQSGSSDTEQGPVDRTLDLGNLELTSKELTSRKATKIAGMKGISSLNLHYYDIFPHSLSKLVTITTLRLYSCKMDPELLLDIRKMSRLKVLLIWDTKIGPQGAKDLIESTNLQRLDLKNTEIGEDGAQHIIDALSKKSTLFVILDDPTVSEEKARKVDNLNKFNFEEL